MLLLLFFFPFILWSYPLFDIEIEGKIGEGKIITIIVIIIYLFYLILFLIVYDVWSFSTIFILRFVVLLC